MHKIQKILFVNPPDPSLLKSGPYAGYGYFEPPLGLLYVYNFIKKRGDVDVKFLDLNIEMGFLSKMTMDDILRLNLKDFQPDLIAIATLYYSGIPVFNSLAKIIKQIDEKILVVFGGHYPHHLTDKCLSDGNIDYAVLSEGELGMSDLIDALNGKKKVMDVEGIAFKKDGVIVRNPRKNFWKGFSDAPRLPWEDTPFQYYFKKGRNLLYRLKPKADFKIAAITASRGCPNPCTFCTSPSFWNRVWRKRNVAHIVEEITYLKNTHGVNTIVFNDENISVDKKWFIELLDELKKLNINWISSGGFALRTINDENVIRKMYESGLCFYNLGIESGSNDSLRKMKKPLSVEETQNTIRLIRKYGNVFVCAFIIIGFPFEDMESVKRTLKFADSLDTDWQNFHCFRPLPGSELFDYCRGNQLIKDFDPNYGELYFAPDFKHIDYTSEQLDRLSYIANLKNNFVQNRNVRLRTEQSLAQAERDFLYVLDMVSDHVFAYLGLAEIMKLRGKPDSCREYILRAKSILEKNQGEWKEYLREFNIDIEKLYREVM